MKRMREVKRYAVWRLHNRSGRDHADSLQRFCKETHERFYVRNANIRGFLPVERSAKESVAEEGRLKVG